MFADEEVAGDEVVVEAAEQPEAVTQTANAANADSPDRAKVEAKTAAAMAKVFGNSTDDEVDVAPAAAPAAKKGPPTKPPVAKPAPAAAAKEEPAGTDAGTDEGATDEAAAPAEAVVNPASGVPAAYRRSLKAFQWTDEEIDAAHEANPEGFLRIATKLHESRNETTRQMSELGRQLRQKQQPEPEPGTAPKPAAKPAQFKKIDVAALREKYGDEDFITQLEAMNGVVEFANDARGFIEQSKQRQAEVELEALGRQIEGYFAGDDIKDYSGLYGKAGTNLTPDQITARQKVIEQADLLIAGSRQMGRPITLTDALTMAHDSVSAPVRAAAATAKVATQVKARQAAISVRPTGRAAGAPAAATNASQLQRNVTAGLAKAFGG